MKKLGTLLGALALGWLIGLPNAAAAGGAVGVGQASFAFCPAGSDKFAVTGVTQASTSGAVFWDFLFVYENTVVSNGICPFATANHCSGFFDPAGVVFPPQVLGCTLGGVLFIGNPAVDGATFTYPVTITWAASIGTMSIAYNYV